MLLNSKVLNYTYTYISKENIFKLTSAYSYIFERFQISWLPLVAAFLRWVLVVRTIKKKKETYNLQPNPTLAHQGMTNNKNWL